MNLSDYHLYIHPPKLDRDYALYCIRFNNRALNARYDFQYALDHVQQGWPFTPNDESTLTYLGTLDQFPELLL